MKHFYWKNRKEAPFPALDRECRGLVFFDRDETLISDPGYLSDPTRIHLLPGVAEGVRKLVQNNWLPLVQTNQSGLARGHFTLETLHEIHLQLHRVLFSLDAPVYSWFFCPHIPRDELRSPYEELPEDAKPYVGTCSCRKPSFGLWEEAFRFLEGSYNIEQTWSVGDRKRDVEPAVERGGGGILIRSGDASDVSPRSGIVQLKDVREAVEFILSG